MGCSVGDVDGWYVMREYVGFGRSVIWDSEDCVGWFKEVGEGLSERYPRITGKKTGDIYKSKFEYCP